MKKILVWLLLSAGALRAQEGAPTSPIVEDQVTVPQDLNEVSDSVVPQEESAVDEDLASVAEDVAEPVEDDAPIAGAESPMPNDDVNEPVAQPEIETPAKVEESGQAQKTPVQDEKELSMATAAREQKSAEPETKEVVAKIPAKPEALKEPTSCKRENIYLELTPPECVPSALDTTDIEAQGNWVIKRAFWEQAEKAYEKIMKVNNTLYEQQAQFVQARNDADKLSDGALRELGFEQGQVKEFINGLIESVKQQREQKGDLNEEGRKLLQELKERQHELEQLSLRLKTLDDLSDALDKVLAAMTEQINVCRNYEKQAWDNFKKIGKELNDKKARLLFYEIDGFLRNAQQTRDYVTQTLWQYMQDTVAQVGKVLEDLKAASSRLQAKGVDIRKQLQEYVALQKNKELLEKQSQTQEALDSAQRAAAECNKELSQGLWGSVKRSTASAWRAITDSVTRGWHWLKGLVGA